MKKYPFAGVYLFYVVGQPQKMYIGSSVNVYRRINQHFSTLQANCHANKKLQNFYNKYPSAQFCYRTIIFVSPRDLISWEQVFLDYCKPYFNICAVADSRLATRHSDIARLKIAASWRNRNKNIFKQNLFTSRPGLL
jgi:group I intron endonuclease